MTAVIAAAYFSLKEVARRTDVGTSAYSGLQKLGLYPRQPAGHHARWEKRSTGDVPDQRARPADPGYPAEFFRQANRESAFLDVAIVDDDFHRPDRDRLVGKLVSGRRTRRGAATSRSGCWRQNRKKIRWAGRCFLISLTYVLRPWPWIITALCSIIIFPDLKSIQHAFPNADVKLIGHDSAFPAMLTFLPTGFVGLMVGGSDCGKFIDDFNASELGIIVSGA